MVAQEQFPTDAPLSLMMAMIATSDTPLLLLAGDLRVVAASTSFCQAFGIEQLSVRGRPLLELGAGEWNVPQLASLLATTASGAVEIHAYRVIDGEEGQLACLT